ncbi:MAG: TonB C-terminal domain-containing protein [Blastocatellia bacterium]
MLQTLNKYIEDQPAPKGLIEYVQRWLVNERRFARLLALSVVFHLAFYATMIILNSWTMRQIKPLRGQPSEFVVITEIAPPSHRPALRSAPELLERADTKQLQYDPEIANDSELLSRSPKPSSERGNDGTLPSSEGVKPASSVGASDRDAGNKSPDQASPPVIASVQPNRASQPSAPVNTAAPSIQPATAPPAPAQKPNANGAADNSQESIQAGARRGDSTESNAFGIQPVQAQYMARVRAKVFKINEANMPRDWVETVLNGKVSAEFSLTIRRGGYIQDLELRRPSGYRVLDGRAREAIYMASPFEGYPQNAGDTITLQVTVYYTPSR